jgi:oligopeptide/dipeptide ABC transporter ATP-binding protein
VLEVKDLKMYFPVRQGLLKRTGDYVKAVDGVSFSLGRGETLGLVGESGCGKTTVGKCLVRLLTPTGGMILFEGRNIAEMKRKELKTYRRQMQIVFQDPYGSLNPRMTVSDIVGEGLLIMGDRHRGEKVAEVLEMVGLSPEDGSRYPHEFSGGQRQRIGIARAVAVGPSFLVCDEPVSALDVSVQAQILNLLEGLKERFSLSLLFIAHDLSVVRHIADRTMVMYMGQVVEEAGTEELFANPAHPYTQVLFASIPSLDPDRRCGLKPIYGEPPSLLDRRPGCAFAPRCPEAREGCIEEEVSLTEVSKGHLVRCRQSGQILSSQV